MSSHPYQSASNVLDAAASGETLPNFDAVGSMLVDLGRTTPLGPGDALRSTAVAAASKASRRGSRLLAIKTLKSLFVAGTVALSSVALVTDQGPAPTTDHAPSGGDAPSGFASPEYEPVSILTGLEPSSSPSLTAGPDLGPGPGLGLGLDLGSVDGSKADDSEFDGVAAGPNHLVGNTGTNPAPATSSATSTTSDIEEDHSDTDHSEDEDEDSHKDVDSNDGNSNEGNSNEDKDKDNEKEKEKEKASGQDNDKNNGKDRDQSENP